MLLDIEEVILLVACLGTVALIAFLIAIGVSSSRAQQELMKQCLADGHKKYECVSMLRSNTSYVPMPIVVGR